MRPARWSLCLGAFFARRRATDPKRERWVRHCLPPDPIPPAYGTLQYLDGKRSLDKYDKASQIAATIALVMLMITMDEIGAPATCSSRHATLLQHTEDRISAMSRRKL
jgi:hypothetical protein